MWLFALADRLGKTIGELERELTLDELAEWIAYIRMTSKD